MNGVPERICIHRCSDLMELLDKDKFFDGDVEYIRSDIANKWRECLEWYFWWEDCEAFCRSDFWWNSARGWNEAKEIRDFAKDKFRALEKELKEAQNE